jgi:hypothetical protein
MPELPEPEGYEDDGLLNDSWTFYFHDPMNNVWTLDSYKRLGDVSSIGDFLAMHTTINEFIPHGMFFLMREHVFPCWDDKHNIDGGCISLKVNGDHVDAVWDELIKRVIGETLSKEDGGGGGSSSSSINGISISPKRGFCIIKLWMSKDYVHSSGGECQLRIPSRYRGEIVFRSNRDNIQLDAAKSTTAKDAPAAVSP